MLIDGREKVGIKTLKNPKAFIDFSQTVDYVYENLEDCNPTKKKRVLIVFEDMIADMESNKNLSSIVTEIFLRGIKLNISLLFIAQFLSEVPEALRLNATHYFIKKIPNKRELQQIASNHSFDIDFRDFMKLYEGYTKEPYSLLVNNTTLSSGNSLQFRKNVL